MQKSEERLMVYVPVPDRDRYYAWWEEITGEKPTEHEWETYRDAMLKMREDFPHAYTDLEKMVDDAIAHPDTGVISGDG